LGRGWGRQLGKVLSFEFWVLSWGNYEARVRWGRLEAAIARETGGTSEKGATGETGELEAGKKVEVEQGGG